jgi:glutamate/tyrosine decarboxylase-like PLP-dependent enzyme
MKLTIEMLLCEQVRRALPVHCAVSDAKLASWARYLREEEYITTIDELKYVATDNEVFGRLALPAIVKVALKRVIADHHESPCVELQQQGKVEDLPDNQKAQQTDDDEEEEKEEGDDNDDNVVDEIYCHLASSSSASSSSNEMTTADEREERKVDGSDYQAVFDALLPAMVDFAQQSGDGSGKTVKDASASELLAHIDVSLPSGEGCSLQSLEAQVRSVLEWSVRSGHPMFLDKLYAGTDAVGVMGEMLISVINANVHTFKSAPVLTMIERECVREMGALVGFDRDRCDGVFCPGGSYSNMLAIFTALQCARRRARAAAANVEAASRSRRYVVVVSERSHYSVKTAVSLLGLADQASMAADNVECDDVERNYWRRGVAPVRCDDGGRIVPSALDATLSALRKRGYTPFVLCATAGTTVMGAFDKFDELANVVARHRDDGCSVWMHIDAAWGGSVALSKRHASLMSGSARANSLTWNPHKMMNVPLQCSVLLTRDSGLLEANLNELGGIANYLFHKKQQHGDDDDDDDERYQCDIGLKTLQCGRRADALKLWLMWKSYGQAGFARQIERKFALARYLHAKVEQHADFVPAFDAAPECLNVCFYYVPRAARKLGLASVEHMLPEHSALLNDTTRQVQAALRRQGSFLTDVSPLPNRPTFLRVIVNNDKVSTGDLDDLLATISSFDL